MFGDNPVRKQEHSDGKTLWIQEVFYTLQGEGIFTGIPAIFVRVGGCNLKCFYCDTDFESSKWNPSLDELIGRINEVNKRRGTLVVISGGEPFRQNIIPLIDELNRLYYSVQIETAGTLWLPGTEYQFPKKEEIDGFIPQNTIICSPKTGKLNEKLIPYIHYFKYIIREGEVAEEDGLPCASTQERGREMLIARPPEKWLKRDVFLQPCDVYKADGNNSNVALARDLCLKFGYRLSLQTHKMLDLR